jgi:Cytosol aminopeptidase family, N-terminal domain
MALLGLASGAIERQAADVLVVPIFAAERPLRGAAGRVDWRLCGRLSHLVAADRVGGDPGEAMLTPGGGGVRAPRVLGLGIGLRAELDGARWESWVADALRRAGALAARSALLALPESAEALPDRMAAVAACTAAIEAPAEVWVAPEPREAAEVGDWLRHALRRARPPGLEIQPPDEVGAARTPLGVAGPASEGVSSHAPAGRFTR